ncbi:DUF397 domain-containing protein [Actinomadura verrucosospora]|uniref:DUF397 domain-containing protein n=1 Tax=Actinomadura verrucosospora TaxID=46165 RepID=UPI001564FAF8
MARSGSAFGDAELTEPDGGRAGAPPRWRTASASGGGGCVEVAGVRASVLVRDSKDTGGPVIAMTREAFAGLLAGIRGRAG